MSTNIWVSTSTIHKCLDSPELVDRKVKRTVEDERASKEKEPTQKAEEDEKKERLRVGDEEERRRPGPLDLPSAQRDVSAPPPSVLLTARVIENLSAVAYPEGIKRPDVELNANVRDGRFRYDRDFLLQFMHICKLKPPTLAALSVLGIEPVDLSSFAGGSGGHRKAPGAMPPSATHQASIGLGIGGFQKPSVPNSFQMGNFQSPGSKLTSEERFALSSNVHSDSPGGASALQFRSLMASTPNQGGSGHPTATNRTPSKRTRTKRGEKRGDASKASMSSGVAPVLGAGFEPVATLEYSANRWVPASATRKAQPDVDSPELVDHKVKALLNKLTVERFDPISDQIIHWANKSVSEQDGRSLIQVIRLVFEHATDEAAWSKIYARLCRKMVEQISPEVQDDGIKNADGNPISGSRLFRMYFLSRCEEEIEREWLGREVALAARTSNDRMDKVVKQKGSEEDEYYAVQKAKRQGLGLMTFLGELFKRQIITEGIMHKCVKKLLGNVENPEEGQLEGLCRLLKMVGQLLDTRKARAHMDVYFTHMKVLDKNLYANRRIQFMLQDVIELRDRKWVRRNDVAAPTTTAVVREATSRSPTFSRAVPTVQAQSRPGVGTHSYTQFEPSMRPTQQPAGTPRSSQPPMPLPSQSAWARGPPQSNSSSVACPIATSHSRPPRALGQGVSIRDGVSVPRNHVGSVVQSASVVFGSIDNASAPLSSSPAAIPAVKTEVAKSIASAPSRADITKLFLGGPGGPGGLAFSTANPSHLNTNARDFVPSGRSTVKVTIKRPDGMEVTLDALKKHNSQPPPVPIPPASSVVTSRRQALVSIRIESEKSKLAREENARKEQGKKDAEERAKKGAAQKMRGSRG